MKHFFLFLFLGFIISCHSSDEEAIAFLDEGMKMSNHSLETKISETMMFLEMRYLENPSQTAKVHYMAKSICNKLDTIRTIVEDQIYMLEYEHRYKSGTFKENNDILNLKFGEYQLLLNSYNEKIGIGEGIQNQSQFSGITQQSNIKNLHLLLSEVQISGVEILLKLKKLIDLKHLAFNQYESVVITRSKKIHTGDYLETKIYSGIIDTSMIFKVIIDNDTLFPVRGKVTYKLKPDVPGNYMVKGILEIDSIYRYSKKTFPFQYLYKVSKQ